MHKFLTTAALALAAPGMIGTALAAPASHGAPMVATGVISAHQYDRYDRGNRYDGYYGRGDYARGYGNQHAYRDNRAWRGNDGRYYCRRSDGTTGALVGGALGGVLGNSVAGRGDRTLGTILGLAGGALLGREIDRGNSRCR